MAFVRTIIAAAALGICASVYCQTPTGSQDNTEIVQYSTINALIKGVYDGDMSIGRMKQLGSFGIGTLNHLDGEMLQLDGKFYQVTSDGEVHVVPDSAQTPFAATTFFKADSTTAGVSVDSLVALEKMIDDGLPSKNFFYAVKVTGMFPSIKVRSVTRQEEPYRPLTEVVADQSIFDYQNTSGTLVGFRCPDFVQGINVAAYHVHFISSDKTKGGHVLGFTLRDGTVELDKLSDFRMILPEDEEFQKLDLSNRGDEAIRKVEKTTGKPDGE